MADFIDKTFAAELEKKILAQISEIHLIFEANLDADRFRYMAGQIKSLRDTIELMKETMKEIEES